MNDLQNVTQGIVISFLSNLEFSSLKRVNNFVHMWNNYDGILVTFSDQEIIDKYILESILLQAHKSKTEFVEYLKSQQEILVKDCVIAYVDILGFKELIENAGNDENKLNQLLNHLNSAYRSAYTRLEDRQSISKRYTFETVNQTRIYTDNIICVKELSPWPSDGEPEIGHLLEHIAHYQLDLALNGHFSRGILVTDKAYCDEKIIFGNSFIHFDEYEKQIKYPRVILDDDTVARVKVYLTWYSRPEICPFKDDLLIDQDKKWFINYLIILKMFNDDLMACKTGKGYYPEAINELKKHRDKVLKNIKLFRHSYDGVFEKYVWLANYHNYFCRNYFALDTALLIEDEDLKEHQFSPII